MVPPEVVLWNMDNWSLVDVHMYTDEKHDPLSALEYGEWPQP